MVNVLQGSGFGTRVAHNASKYGKMQSGIIEDLEAEEFLRRLEDIIYSSIDRRESIGDSCNIQISNKDALQVNK